MQAPPNGFVRDSSVHPRRGNLDNDAVARYVDRYEAGEQPQPVVVQQGTMTVVDGWHRIEAASRAGLPELAYREIDVPYEDISRTAFTLNRDHGVPVSKEQRNAMIVADSERFTQSELAEFYGLSRQAIGYILETNVSNAKTGNANKTDHRRKVQSADVTAAWRLNPDATQEELAGMFDVGQSRVSQIISEFKTHIVGSYESGKLKMEVADEHNLPVETVDGILLEAEREPINFEPKIYQVWGFSGRDKRYGQKHPGQLPAQLLQNLLYYYTRPGDHVVDLFAGGGVTLDVAADMVSRTCSGYDIEPVRGDIQKWDILESTFGSYEVTLPETVTDTDLVFLDPPYWKQNAGEYTEQETDLSNLSLELFHNVLSRIILDCLSQVKPGALVALIVGPTQDKWELIDHSAHIIRRVGVPMHRIQVPYSTQQHGGNYVKIAKENRRWLYQSRDLMIWKSSTGPQE